MIIRDTKLDTKQQIHMMGILNVTDDSFSDGGNYNNIDAALKHAEDMIKEGATIIDVGGESTRPGYVMISDEEEIEKTAPVIEKLRANFDTFISLDTYKSKVAKAGIEAGADMINDIWGLQYDPHMAEVVAQSKVAYCLMHNRKEATYHNFLNDLIFDLEKSLDIAQKAGIEYERICIDPGIGFAKNYEENLMTMNHLEMLHNFGLPILLGTSRKSMIGITLDAKVTERLEGTIATSVIGVMKGVSIFRVHDVKANLQAIKMAKAISQIG